MSINGSVPAHAYFGVPVYGNRPAAQQAGSRMATGSGPYLGRGNKCEANNNTCKGNKVKGEDLCAGHLRSKKLKAKEESVEVSDGV